MPPHTILFSLLHLSTLTALSPLARGSAILMGNLGLSTGATFSPGALEQCSLSQHLLPLYQFAWSTYLEIPSEIIDHDVIISYFQIESPDVMIH